jgi:transposase InsO family protein
MAHQVLYCWFVIEHNRRKILHFNVTAHPTCEWVLQQLREAFPDAAAYRYVVFDHDSKFNPDVIAFLQATGLTPKRTSIQAPWQNGIAERWVGSCRRELLDHVIALSEAHLRRLIAEYVRYYHEDRPHDSLQKDSPTPRQTETKPPAATVCSMPRWRPSPTIRLAGSCLRDRPRST